MLLDHWTSSDLRAPMPHEGQLLQALAKVGINSLPLSLRRSFTDCVATAIVVLHLMMTKDPEAKVGLQIA